MTPEGEEIRTIFVTGFPPDAKEREVQNMLRWWPGYEACQLTFKGDQPLGFAIFSTPAMAFAARDALQGLIFDADHNSVLRVELAKTNLHRRKGLPGGGDGYDHSKRSRVDPMAAYMPGAAAAAMGSFMPAAYDAYASSFTPLPAAPAAAPKTYTPLPAPPSGMPGKIYRDNPPCNTLYLGNLGMQVSEAELLQIFSVRHQVLYLYLLLTICSVPPTAPFSSPPPVFSPGRGISISSAHGAAGQLSRLLFPSCSSALPISPSSALLPFSPLHSCQDVEAASAVHTALQGISLASSSPHLPPSFPSCLFLPSSPLPQQDVDAASAVHTALQGISLASSDRGPVRVQYPHHHHSPTALTHTLPGPIPSCPPALLSPQHASVPFRPTFPLPRFLSPLLSCALFRPIALLVF
ncbi:unnamed protein product [Closterium sp. NIES-54]